MSNSNAKTYEYKRFMRDGSTKTVTAVVRSRSEGKVAKKAKKSAASE